MKPLISFIVTYHNEPEVFLQALLASICALPLHEGEAEVIVVDDGSATPPHVSRDGMRYVRQEQAGLSVARNTGISHAMGEYIQFVDADDALIPATYKIVLEQVRLRDADVVMFRHSTKPLSAAGTFTRQLLAGSFLLRHRNLRAAAWGYAFRKDILGDLRFHPGLLHEDELFTPLLILRAKCVCELNVKAYFYRQHANTITSSNSLEQKKKRLDDIHFVLRELRNQDEPLLERKIRQLTADYLQKVLVLTHSLRELRCRVSKLRDEDFLPLPLKCYSFRYLFIALLTKVSC